MAIYWHKHHIIPRHMGGSDDPSNIIKVNLALHAFLHKLLWEEHHNQEDYIAFKGLSGQITMKEASFQAMKLGASKGGKKPKTEEHKNKIRNATLRTIENGTHNLIGMNQIRIKNGTHNFLGGYATRKQYAEGKHPAHNKVICPHCGRSGAYFNMKRYHFDLCKSKPPS